MYDLDKLEQLEKEATPAPWEISSNPLRPGVTFRLGNADVYIAIDTEGPDAEFIAALRNAAPEMIADLRRLKAENRRLMDSLIQIERVCGEIPIWTHGILAIYRIASKSLENADADGSASEHG